MSFASPSRSAARATLFGETCRWEGRCSKWQLPDDLSIGGSGSDDGRDVEPKTLRFPPFKGDMRETGLSEAGTRGLMPIKWGYPAACVTELWDWLDEGKGAVFDQQFRVIS